MSWRRLFSFSAQCAIVTVTPEESSSKVLIAGMPNAAIGVKGSAKVGPAEGQCEVNPGHMSAFDSMVERSGTEICRIQNSAPKNAAKNITSEKMNQLIPQRKDMSSQAPYLPPSDSRMMSPNQRTIMKMRTIRPVAIPTQPGVWPLNRNTAPSAMRKSAVEPMIGQGIGCGTA